MLHFKLNDTSADLILTLTENVSTASPFYLFIFTHTLTKDVVAFVKSPVDDNSSYPDRYNQFNINPAVVFSGKQPGEWLYTVYQQPDAVNTDPTTTDGVLETGKLLIYRAAEFAFTMYDTATTYTTYNG